MPSYREPFQSSVHRYAATALYRALIRGTRLENVPVPDRSLLRATFAERFRKNRHVQKPYEVQAALLLGYHTVDILRSAPSNGPSIVSALVEKIKQVCPPQPPRPRAKSNEERKRLIEAGTLKGSVVWKRPNTMSVFEERPLPLEKLRARKANSESGEDWGADEREENGDKATSPARFRRVPKYSLAHGFAFLRLSKPQSPYLTRILRQKIQTHVDLFERQEVLEQKKTEGAQEDLWDKKIAEVLRQAKKEELPAAETGVEETKREETGLEKESTEEMSEGNWAAAPAASLSAANQINNKNFRKRLASNEKVWSIFKAERAMAKEERRERKEKKWKAKQQLKQDQQAAKGR